MDKNISLQAIQNARKIHEEQMTKIEDAIAGNFVEDPTKPIKTECTFGMWLYDENLHVKEILGAQFFNTIETNHTKWHNEYLEVFNILFKNQKKQGFLSKMMKTKAIDPMELDRAKAYYADLKITSAELLKIVDASQRRMDAMSEAKFR